MNLDVNKIIEESVKGVIDKDDDIIAEGVDLDGKDIIQEGAELDDLDIMAEEYEASVDYFKDYFKEDDSDSKK